MATLLDRNASVIGNEVRLGDFSSHAEALAALNTARRFEENARALAKEVLSLNPTAGELGEGMARNLQALAGRLA